MLVKCKSEDHTLRFGRCRRNAFNKFNLIYPHTHTLAHSLTGAHSHTRRSSHLHLTVCRT